MPGRTRRLRFLLALIFLIALAVIYTRPASTHVYPTHLSEFIPGAGPLSSQEPGFATLPTEAKQQGAESTSIAGVEPGLVSPLDPPPPPPLPQRPTPSPPPLPPLPPLPPDFPPADWIEKHLPIPLEHGRFETNSRLGEASVHWQPQEEHFPVSSTIQLPTATPKTLPRIQYSSKVRADQERRAAVKAATEHAWAGYREVAWAADEVKPVSGGLYNPFNGWGATLVDSLDTLWIMGMKDAFEEAVDAVGNIDFTTSPRSDIPVFEVTIRYLGGLIAAYDVSGAKYRSLLDKAVELAEILYSAFDTPNRLPETYYRWKPAFASQPHQASRGAVLAEVGSLSMEFTRLAQLTGEPKYYDAIARITDALDEWQNSTRLPGMWPTRFDASGCLKPDQIESDPTRLQQVVPGGNGEMMEAGKPVEAVRPGGVTRQPPPQRELDETITMGTPGIGKIQRFGVDESSQSEVDHLAAVKKVGGSAASGPDSAPFGRDGLARRPSMGEISGFNRGGDPDSTLDGLSKNENLAEDVKSPKSKRQLDDTIVTSVPPQSHPDNASPQNDVPHQKNPNVLPGRKPSQRTGRNVCTPGGLASQNQFLTETFTLGGMSDSTYEYLSKQYLLLGGNVEQYRDMYIASAETATDALVFRPMVEDERDILISGELKLALHIPSGKYLEEFTPVLEHLTCFTGGMFAMGGKIFDRPQDVEIGRKLTEGCIWAYESTASGIMPESFTVVKCADKLDCVWNETKYRRALDPYESARTRLPKKVTVWDKPTAMPTASITSLSAVPTANEVMRQAVAFDPNVVDKRQLNEASLDKSRTPNPASNIAAEPVEYDIGAQHRPGPSPSYSVWSPPPPLSHDEFVDARIKGERLPSGFVQITGGRYLLRPEAIESVFYMHRITGDPYWRDVGWRMFQAIDRHTFAQYGHSALEDVTQTTPRMLDSMESFWIAETLKYFYLLFDDSDTWSLDDWVLNTEAHFFRRPK